MPILGLQSLKETLNDIFLAFASASFAALEGGVGESRLNLFFNGSVGEVALGLFDFLIFFLHFLDFVF